MQRWLLQHISVRWIHNPVYLWAKKCQKMTWQSWRLCVFHSPFQYLSESVCKIPILRANFDRQNFPLCPPHQYSSLRIQLVFHVEHFCVAVKHKSRENLRDVVYTSMLLKVLEHCVSWQHDNSNHPVIMLKNWDTAYNTRFQLNISFVPYNIVSGNFGSTMIASYFFFSD